MRIYIVVTIWWNGDNYVPQYTINEKVFFFKKSAEKYRKFLNDPKPKNCIKVEIQTEKISFNI